MSTASCTVDVASIRIKPRRVVSGHALRALVARIVAIVQDWRNRRRDPTRLYRLNDHVLKDIGLTRAEIDRAALESFWRD